MKREWHKWFSPRLGRDMELLVYGHAGLPVIVFPTSQGRFYEFEDNGMVGTVAHKIDNGEVMLICVDSVDSESWYNRNVGARWRIARHVQYESYVMDEVIPLIRALGNWGQVAAMGCSFGGYHALNIALRHPDVFQAFLSLGGAFEMSAFLDGYYDDDVYFNQPTHYLPNQHDSWYLDRYRHNTYILVAGEHDICRGRTEYMAEVMRRKGIPVRLDIWGDGSEHDWQEWRKMINVYL